MIVKVRWFIFFFFFTSFLFFVAEMEAAIDTLLKKYVHSVNTCDLELVKKIWNDEGEISFLHPRGYEHSIDEVIQHFYLGTMDRLFTERNLFLKCLKSKVYTDTAFLEFQWDFYAKERETGKEIHHEGRETQFLVWKNNEWRIVNIHYSLLPVL